MRTASCEVVDVAMDTRPEHPADQTAIRAVHEASFPTTYEARLVDALRAADNLHVSLVAQERQSVVGHVAFSRVSVAGATDGVGLAPLAVLAASRRHGIGERLVRAGLMICEHAGNGFVVVLGDPAYYGRFGFERASRWGLVDEYGGGEAFQALELRPGAIPVGAGVVRYAPEFAAAEDTATS